MILNTLRKLQIVLAAPATTNNLPVLMYYTDTNEMAVADSAVITSDKLLYLLTAGGGKDGGFRLLGYTLENPEALRKVLLATSELIDATAPQAVTQFGTKFKVVIQLIGPNGKEGIVEVIWQQDVGSTIYRLITATPHPFS